jgi:hypothetical protein
MAQTDRPLDVLPGPGPAAPSRSVATCEATQVLMAVQVHNLLARTHKYPT